METHKRIIITGKGGSGKDLLKTRFIKKGFKPSISFTTRPPRKGEVDGVDYYFINDRTFDRMIGKKEFFEFKEFRDWMYGTHVSDFASCDVFILTPPAISEMPKIIRDSSIVIYIDIEESILNKRLSDRNDADVVKRRVKADREMFDVFVDYDMRITDPTF